MTNETTASPPPEDRTDEPVSVASAVRGAIERSGGPIGIAVAAAPTVAFVVTDALGGLAWAFLALAGTASAAFGVRLARRESVRAALVGLAVAAACAVVAAVSGEARAFFLLPTLLPAVLMLVFLGSVVVRRPLTGTLFNRMAGGPRDWRQHSALLRVYSITTLVAVAIHAVNFAVRIVFYLADQPAVLAAVQIAAGPVFAALAAATLLAARRAVHPAAPGPAAV
jgi:hypothetical protein